MSTHETQPGAPRDLPDFLKSGDPALTWPHGKTYGVNHPKGVPRDPCATDPQSADRELAREWLDHLAAGRIGPRSSAHPEPVEVSP